MIYWSKLSSLYCKNVEIYRNKIGLPFVILVHVHPKMIENGFFEGLEAQAF